MPREDYDCMTVIFQENGAGADKIMMALRTACDKYDKLYAETNEVYNEIYDYIDNLADYFITIVKYVNCNFIKVGPIFL